MAQVGRWLGKRPKETAEGQAVCKWIFESTTREEPHVYVPADLFPHKTFEGCKEREKVG